MVEVAVPVTERAPSTVRVLEKDPVVPEISFPLKLESVMVPPEKVELAIWTWPSLSILLDWEMTW